MTFLRAHGTVLILSMTSTCDAQGWERVLQGPARDEAFGVASDHAGGAFTVGATASFGAGRTDGFVAHLDGVGALSWAETIGGARDDRLLAVIATSAGGIACAGASQSFGSGRDESWLVDLRADGTVAWQLTLGGSDDDVAQGVAELPDGSLVVVGSTASFGAGGRDAWAARVGPDGTPAWAITLGSPGDEELRGVAVLSDGALVAAGSTTSLDPAGDALLVGLDPATGAIAWQRAYQGAGHDALASIAALPSGLVAVGATYAAIVDSVVALVLEAEATGDLRSAGIHASTRGSTAEGVAVLRGGIEAIAGDECAGSAGGGCGIGGGGNWDAIAMVPNVRPGAGRFTRFGGRFSDRGHGIAAIADETYMLAGVTDSFRDPSGDALLLAFEQVSSSWLFCSTLLDSSWTPYDNPLTTRDASLVSVALPAAWSASSGLLAPAPFVIEGPCPPDTCATLTCDQIVVDPDPPCQGRRQTLSIAYSGGAGAVAIQWDLDGDTAADDASGEGVPVDFPYGTWTVRAVVTDSCTSPALQTCEISRTLAVLRCDPPGEVSNVLAGRPPLLVARVRSQERLSFEREPMTTAFNLYVDAIGSWYAPGLSGAGACHVRTWVAQPDGSIAIDHPLPSGSWVVVTGSNEVGEGPAGQNSAWIERMTVGLWSPCGPTP